MASVSKTLRYQLPKKAIKTDCPDCGPRHRKTLSRYLDTRTDEPLPEQYGRCDRESNCGYHLSPYHKEPSGMSYADAVYQQWKEDNPLPVRATAHQPDHRMPHAGNSLETAFSIAQSHRQRVSSPPPVMTPICSIPDDVFNQSLSYYERNQFVQLLIQHFGVSVANELRQRFQIGTSSRWPGACVFWYIDEENRKRGGQIKLFGPDWHTEKYVDRQGRKRSKTSWVHSALIYRLQKLGASLPDWLVEYNEKGDRSPCLFGLPQLLSEPANKPVAIVEAPKTAILCTPYFQRFTWLAIGSLAYLNAYRLSSVKNRHITLFPDLSEHGTAFARWSRIADQLRPQGFSIAVSDYLEQQSTTDKQKKDGLDLADWIIDEWKGYPPDWDIASHS